MDLRAEALSRQGFVKPYSITPYTYGRAGAPAPRTFRSPDGLWQLTDHGFEMVLRAGGGG